MKDARFDTMAKRAENAKELVPILDKAFASKPREYWMKALKEGGDFIYTVVNSIDDLMRDEQMLAERLYRRLRSSTHRKNQTGRISASIE